MYLRCTEDNVVTKGKILMVIYSDEVHDEKLGIFYDLYSVWALLLFNVLKEAITITLAAVAASHSVIPRTFSGNSLVAEIHLQIYLVSPFVFLARHSWFLFFNELDERGTGESHKSGKDAVAIISCIILSGLKYTQMTWGGSREMGREGEHPVGASFIEYKTLIFLFPN